MNPQWSGLCLLFHAQTFSNPVGAVSSPSTAVLGKEGSCGSTPHSYTAHLKQLRGFAVTEDMHLSQVMTPRTKTNSMHREDLLMTRSQVTPVLQEGNVPRSTTRNSLPAPPSVPSDHFYDHESDDCASGSAGRSNPMQKTHGMDREDVKNITLSMDSQEFSIRNRISEELTRSDLGSMERDGRFALLNQGQNSKSQSVDTKDTQGMPSQSGCERIFRKFRSYDDARL